jgi:hypothetical protein
MAIVVEGNRSIEIGFWMNTRLFEAMNDYMSNEYWASIDPEDLSVTLIINNDLREDVTIRLRNVYANQVPIVDTQQYELRRRGTLSIRSSNVMRDFAFTNNVAMFGEIPLPE